MLPRRKLSEVMTSSRVNAKVCHIVVEGQSDRVILASYCEGERIPVLIYPVPSLEIDCVPASGLGGNRANVLRISAFLSQHEVTRIFCIIDRDGDGFDGFDLNSHCLVTDLSCVQIYPLDVEEFRTYVTRAFYSSFTSEALLSVLSVSRMISVMHWLKEKKLSGYSLANVDGSLRFVDGLIRLDVPGWLRRSISRGGDPEVWKGLETDLTAAETSFGADYRAMVRVHDLDNVFRFWLRSAHQRALHIGWVEEFLRGTASHEKLAPYEFFRAIRRRCALELAIP
jgi:hypothetical protein